MEAAYFSAIQNADLLGIPCPKRVGQIFSNVPVGSPYFNLEARGLKAIFDFLSISEKEGRGDSSNLQILTSCHIHSHLEDMELWDLILSEINDCSIISCHPQLVEVLWEKHNITVREFYPIPSEYKYSRLFDHDQSDTAPHYPDRFNFIKTNLTVAYPGEVFLVAAGFLGKFYCQIIKEKGGIALDVGSAADYWLDYKTRVWTKFPNPLAVTNKEMI